MSITHRNETMQVNEYAGNPHLEANGTGLHFNSKSAVGRLPWAWVTRADVSVGGAFKPEEGIPSELIIHCARSAVFRFKFRGDAAARALPEFAATVNAYAQPN
jgi:hypothetical protein